MPFRFRIGDQVVNFDNLAPGADELDELIDVDVETATSGSVLTYDGIEWSSSPISNILNPVYSQLSVEGHLLKETSQIISYDAGIDYSLSNNVAWVTQGSGTLQYVTEEDVNLMSDGQFNLACVSSRVDTEINFSEITTYQQYFGPYPAEVVGHLNLNTSTLADSSGAGMVANYEPGISSSPTIDVLDTPVVGSTKYSLNFSANAGADLITSPNSIKINYKNELGINQNNKNLTISFWIKNTQDIPFFPEQTEILVKGSTINGSEYYIRRLSNTSINFRLVRDDLTTVSHTITGLQPNVWKHVIISISDSTLSGSIKSYVNGALNSTTNVNNYAYRTDISRDLYIGSTTNDSTDFNGKLASILFVNKAVNDTEALSLYQSELTNSTPTLQIVSVTNSTLSVTASNFNQSFNNATIDYVFSGRDFFGNEFELTKTQFITFINDVSLIDSFFVSDVNGGIYATGSLALKGTNNSIYSPSDVGTDVYFFVSGNISSKPAQTPDYSNVGTTVFGGDVVVSGTLFGDSQLHLGSPISIIGNQISGSSGGNIELQNDGNVKIIGDIQIDGNDIKSNDGSTAISLSSATAILPGNLIVSGNSYVGNTSGDKLFVTASSYFGSDVEFTTIATFNDQVTLKFDGTDVSPQLSLEGATLNRIDMSNVGLGAPSTGIRSDGVKLILWKGNLSTNVDYALGIDSSTFWSSIGNSSDSFKWYAGTNVIATLSGGGNLTVTNDLTVNNTIKANGSTYTAVGGIPLTIKQSVDSASGGIMLERSGTGPVNNWRIAINSSDNLEFFFGTNTRGYLDNGANEGNLDFTGQHRSTIKNEELLSEYTVGLIVVSCGSYNNMRQEKISINEALPVIRLSNIRNQKSVFGVISDVEDSNSDYREYKNGTFVSVFEKRQDDNRLIINSLGEGAIWITNINGDLENGDYITSCEIPGYGMKQDEYFLCNFTVAKITCDCNFDLNSTIYRCEEFEWNGQTYRKAFVGCTYHCG